MIDVQAYVHSLVSRLLRWQRERPWIQLFAHMLIMCKQHVGHSRVCEFVVHKICSGLEQDQEIQGAVKKQRSLLIETSHITYFQLN